MNAILASWRKLVHLNMVKREIADQLDTIESILSIEALENEALEKAQPARILNYWLMAAEEAGIITHNEMEKIDFYIRPLAIRRSG